MNPVSSPKIVSQTGVDYTNLLTLLQTAQWQAADRETMITMLLAVDRTVAGYLRASDIDRLPTEDLQIINALWMQASQGQFGFSMQKQIWHSAAENYTDFGDRVGWHRQGSWLNYEELNFTQNAPPGHLPAVMFPSPMPGGVHVASFVLGKWRTLLLSRSDLTSNSIPVAIETSA